MEVKDKIVLPTGFEEMVRGVIGDVEWDAFVEALSEEPSVSVRINAQCTMYNAQLIDGQQTTDNRQQSIDAIQPSTLNFIAKGSKTFGFQLSILSPKAQRPSVLNSQLIFGLICTGDQFISDLATLQGIKRNFPDGKAVDMESAAIAQVCYAKQVPFMSLRIVSDTPGMEPDNTTQYLDFFAEAPKKTFAVLRQLIEMI